MRSLYVLRSSGPEVQVAFHITCIEHRALDIVVFQKRKSM